MTENYPSKSGNIVDIKSNTILGKHTGISKYTIGQRRGLNLGGKNGYEAERWFVVKIEPQTNTLYVSCGESDEMYSSGCVVTEFNWISNKPQGEFESKVKLRARQPAQQTKVTIIDENTIRLNFKTKQRAVTIGQYAVLYAEDGTCYGGGRINELLK